jgi:hypothetical protein
VLKVSIQVKDDVAAAVIDAVAAAAMVSWFAAGR